MASETHTESVITCRYCLINTNDHIAQYFFLDSQNKYEKMLEDTFNIEVCYTENKNLCLSCLENTKKAASLKKMVLEVQKTLKEHSEKWTILDSVLPKKESTKFENSNYFENDDNDLGDNGEMCDDFNHTGDSCQRKGIHDTDDDFNLESDDCSFIETSIKLDKIDNNKTPQLKNGNDHRNVTKSSKKKARGPSISNNKMQLRKNTLALIYNSNMCLFNTKQTKYGCYFCKEHFFDIKTLKSHSETHEKAKDIIAQSIRQNQGYTMKNVEISNLACKQCLQPCKDLERLQSHLESAHGVFFEGTGHLLVPYKIEDDFKCAICDAEFLSLVRLVVHMNCHSTINVCETCGSAFNSRVKLNSHIKSVHTVNKCTKCPAVFPSFATKYKHIQSVHNGPESKRYCKHCPMIFRYGYQLRLHMQETHGVKRKSHICRLCMKQFASDNGVKIHYKVVHVGERRYACDVCRRMFCTSTDKRRHERTHVNDRPFHCEFCDVKLKSKDSMQRHLKTKHGDAKKDKED